MRVQAISKIMHVFILPSRRPQGTKWLPSEPWRFVYLNAAAAERGVPIEAGDPGDLEAVCAPVLDADFRWWGGKGYRKQRHTHSAIINHRRPSGPTDTLTPSLFPFLKIRKIKHKFERGWLC